MRGRDLAFPCFLFILFLFFGGLFLGFLLIMLLGRNAFSNGLGLLLFFLGLLRATSLFGILVCLA